MIDIIEEFGRNAGELWKTLNALGPLPETKLMENARLQEDEFYVAVGWLARENKICKTGPLYKLGETNLIAKIGSDAGKVLDVIDKRRKIDVLDIANILQIEEREVYSALGWLAKENKIEPKTTIPKEYRIKNK